jgi:MFS family permease
VYLDLFANKQYRYAVLGYVAQTFALGGFSEWAAPLLSRKLCFDLAKGNIVFGGITAATGLVGTAVGGIIADRVPGDDRTRAALKVCAWSSAIAVPLAAFALASGEATAFLVLLGLAELVIFASTSPTNAAVLDSVSPAQRANAMAASIFAIHLLGDLVSPPAIGAISDALHDPQGECSGARGLTIGMGLLPIALAISALAWSRGARAERVRLPDTA